MDNESVFKQTISKFKYASTSSPTKKLTSNSITSNSNPKKRSASPSLPSSSSSTPIASTSTYFPPTSSSPSASPTKKKKKGSRPYADPTKYSNLSPLADEEFKIKGLNLLFCGINPSILSSEKGQPCTSLSLSLLTSIASFSIRSLTFLLP